MINKILFYVILLACVCTNIAHGAFGIFQVNGPAAFAGCTPNGSDGSGAPATGTTIQFPAILNGYAVRPTWCVAGVDYAVGIPATIAASLKDPLNMVMPTSGVGGFGPNLATNGATASGNILHFASTQFIVKGAKVTDNTGGGTQIPANTFVTAITSSTTITISQNVSSAVGNGDSIGFSGVIVLAPGWLGAAAPQIEVNGPNIDLSGWDFSLEGGWSITPDYQSDGLIIENSKLRVDANGQVPLTDGNSNPSGGTWENGITIQYCLIDGNTGASQGSAQGMVQKILHGTVLIQYNYMLNPASTFTLFQNDGVTLTNITYRYNIFANSGASTTIGGGVHNDITYAESPVTTQYSTWNFDYNLVIQTTWGQNISPGGQGIILGGTTGISASNNTVVATATNGTLLNVFQIWNEDSIVSIGSQPGIKNNFLDLSGTVSTFFINKVCNSGAAMCAGNTATLQNSLPSTGNTNMKTNTLPGAWNGLL